MEGTFSGQHPVGEDCLTQCCSAGDLVPGPAPPLGLRHRVGSWWCLQGLQGEGRGAPFRWNPLCIREAEIGPGPRAASYWRGPPSEGPGRMRGEWDKEPLTSAPHWAQGGRPLWRLLRRL